MSDLESRDALPTTFAGVRDARLAPMSPVRPLLSVRLLGFLCLVTALANMGGNLLIFLFYQPIFELFGVPLPQDLATFAFVCGFSFTIGLLAYLIYRNPWQSLDLLVVGICGKAIYAGLTAYFFYERDLHWFYLIFGLWDAAFVVVFFLLLIQIVSPDVSALNAGAIRKGVPGRKSRKALLLYYSLTGNGRRAMQRVRAGLERVGYTVDEMTVDAVEPLFRFPFGLWAFVRIMVRSIFRVPARARPLGLAADHDYDLIVVECQTWFLGMGSPMEGMFQEPANHRIFAGRDVAAVVVCRGLGRRTLSMLVRWLERVGGNVVGARSFANPGREPLRTFSLFLFLGFGEPDRPRFLRRLLTSPYLSEQSLAELERFGEALARRGAPGLAQVSATVMTPREAK